VFIDHEVRTTT